MREFKQVVSETTERHQFMSNVYSSEEEAYENKKDGYLPIFARREDGAPATGWMNYCKHGFQEDGVENLRKDLRIL